MLNRTPYNVPFSARDNVGNSVARVNDGSGQRRSVTLLEDQEAAEGEHCLDGQCRDP